jgi:hypothetical protein
MGMKVSLSSRKLAATAILLLSARVAFADRANPVFQDSGGVAIRGYDLVAYFTDQKPVKGSEQFTYTWMGATWRFASPPTVTSSPPIPPTTRRNMAGIVRTPSAKDTPPLPILKPGVS